ncbi:Nmad3 family putative nucleotide modification protein [Burkholderia stagnalis]
MKDAQGASMKVVLSRKGFDSQFGGMPSPILPDGRLVPLPIPSEHDDVTLADLDFADAQLDRLISDLSAGKHGLQRRVHFDPDLGGRRGANLANWRPALGQTGAAQSHLSRHGVGAGDVFLFFGWFRRTECTDGKWRFVPRAPDLHVLFGWLEVDEVWPIVTQRDDALRRHSWIAAHPHVVAPDWYTDPRNTLYIARKRSAYARTKAAGGGRFPLMRPELQLTCPGQSRSVWLLPRWFAPDGREPMSYHANANRWEVREDGVVLRSVAKGQEFVIDGALYPELESWVAGLIRRHA